MRYKTPKLIFLLLIIVSGATMIGVIAHELTHVVQAERADAICLSLNAEANDGAFAFVEGDFSNDKYIDVLNYNISWMEIVAELISITTSLVVTIYCILILLEWKAKDL